MPLSFIRQELNELKKQDLFRSLKIIESAQDKTVFIAGKKYLLFSSNNYLGLATHPKIKEAVRKAISLYGIGSGASRLISGTSVPHDQLEKTIASFKKTESALVFPTGYMANIGLITALVDGRDVIIIDKLNHASIIDAAYQSQAKIRVYPHKNMAMLEKILQQSKSYRRRLIVTDTIFSMDGDIAPLSEINHLAKKYHAITMVDEAHATGIIGKNRRGVLEQYNLEGKIDIVMGTLSKAIGCLGGYITGEKTLIDYFINKARSFIFTTSLPPALCRAAEQSIQIIQSEEGEKLKQKLWDNISLLKQGLAHLKFDTLESETQIIPVLIGDTHKALDVSRELLKRNFLIPAIRFPTVPKNKSRLRLTLMATHTKKDIFSLLNALEDIKKKFHL